LSPGIGLAFGCSGAFDRVQRAWAAKDRCRSSNSDPVWSKNWSAQETTVKLLLRKKKEKIRNWLAFLSTSVRLTLVKLIKRDEAALRPAVTPTCSDLKSAEAIFSHILVNELESQLPEKDLEIVRLSEFESGLEEIAKLKNISPEAARKRYYRSIKTIRRVLQSQTEEGKDGVAK
jgi:DNA-directed RNA polymerase specialized sigma24 family protein